MSDYISREAALTELCRGCSLHSNKPDFFCGETSCGKYNRIKAIPAADVREVVRGKWKPIKPYNNTYMGFECSECGAQFQGIHMDNFCGNCGAEMRGTDDAS